MEDLKITVPHAIHPTVVQPCGCCGKMIEGYSRTIHVMLAGWPMSEPHIFLLHPECVDEFASKLLSCS